ncbi:MAG: hypothetical protein IH840_17055 [Candidatus Heimdallarchaeota archaeon]|nr:hypothetical protein [Candidatus Heimdallarchaeota archaeon]
MPPIDENPITATSSEANPTEGDPDLLILIIAIAVIVVLISLSSIFLVTRRRKSKALITLSKEGILIRMSEIHSLLSIMIISNQDGSVLFRNDWKSDPSLQELVRKIKTAYTLTDTTTLDDSVTSQLANKTLTNFVTGEFVHVHRSVGSIIDIFLMSASPIPLVLPALELFAKWMGIQSDFDNIQDIQNLFSEDEFETITHIQFDTWTKYKLKTTVDLEIDDNLELITQEILSLFIEKDKMTFTQLVGIFNKKYNVEELYNELRNLLIGQKLSILD